MGRPALPRYRADVVVAIEVAAETEEAANARIEAILDTIRPRVGATVRATRLGAPTVVQVHSLENASAV